MLKLQVDPEPVDGSALKAEVDTTVGEFETWFMGQGNSPLIGPERAIINTFLWWLHQQRHGGK